MAINKDTKRWIIVIIVMTIIVLIIDLLLNHVINK